jgi:hypothetical protein
VAFSEESFNELRVVSRNDVWHQSLDAVQLCQLLFAVAKVPNGGRRDSIDQESIMIPIEIRYNVGYIVSEKVNFNSICNLSNAVIFKSSETTQLPGLQVVVKYFTFEQQNNRLHPVA